MDIILQIVQRKMMINEMRKETKNIIETIIKVIIQTIIKVIIQTTIKVTIQTIIRITTKEIKIPDHLIDHKITNEIKKIDLKVKIETLIIIGIGIEITEAKAAQEININMIERANMIVYHLLILKILIFLTMIMMIKRNLK
jgi:hypothetical protein